MDLLAYMQISNLEKIAKKNNIEIPRLRGYRLMKNEQPISEEEIARLLKESEITVCERLCRSEPFWAAKANYISHNRKTDILCAQYLVTDPENDSNFVDINWEKIKGKKLTVLKAEIEKAKARITDQFDLWNKYAGQEGILYIHARIGGNNWKAYGGQELKKQPWFLEKVDDAFDSTYCDIYAKIND